MTCLSFTINGHRLASTFLSLPQIYWVKCLIANHSLLAGSNAQVKIRLRQGRRTHRKDRWRANVRYDLNYLN